MSISPERPRRIVGKAPWYVRPFLRFFLSKCAECPERIRCFEGLLGPGVIEELLTFRCPEIRQATNLKSKIAGLFDFPLRLLSKYVARFLREECLPCRSLGACCYAVLIEVKDIEIRAAPASLKGEADWMSYDVRKCASCPKLAPCIEQKIKGKKIKVGMLLLRFIRMRFSCLIGLRN